jgi:hypothetical protein
METKLPFIFVLFRNIVIVCFNQFISEYFNNSFVLKAIKNYNINIYDCFVI